MIRREFLAGGACSPKKLARFSMDGAAGCQPAETQS